MVRHLRMRQKLYELAAPDLDRKEEHGALAVMMYLHIQPILCSEIGADRAGADVLYEVIET
jgi:hypothetical protein